jgi:hypothetical protein
MNRDLTSAEETETRNGLNGPALPLRRFPITAIASITIDDVAVDVSGFRFNDNMLYRKSGIIPRGQANVIVTYTAGLAAIPEDVQQAVLYTAKAIWDARRTDMNLSSESYAGIGSGGFWQDGPGSVPPQAKVLLDDYKAVFFG